MSGLVETKKREWHEKDCSPLCPTCWNPIEIIRWEAGHATCGENDCVDTYVKTFLQKGWEWDGLDAIPLDSGARMADKPVITRETSPSGTIVLTKKGGAVKQDKSKDSKSKVGDKGSYIPPKQTPKKIYSPIADLERKMVYITPQCWWDLQFLVRSCEIEISGLGIVDTTSHGLIIKKIFLLKQDSGGSHTELDPEAIAQLMMEVDAAGEDTGKIRFWWHSHPFSRGKPSPSGQDQETFASFGRGGQHSPDWYINAIFSGEGESYWRMDVYRPVRTAIDIQPTMWHPDFGSCDWETEIKEKVKLGGTGPGLVRVHNYSPHQGGHAGWPGGFGY